MPYKSKAQMKFFHANPKMARFVDEWDKATKNPKKLPMRVKKVKKSKKK